MKQKRHTTDQIIASFRQADVELGKEEGSRGMQDPGDQFSDLLPLASEVRGMKPSMTKELKALQKENARLKKMVAEQALDMEILKEAAKGNW